MIKNINNKAANFFRKIVSPTYQAFAIILTMTIVIITGYISRQEFRPAEEMPQLFPITPEKLKKWGGNPATVKTGFYIINFPEFDIVKKTFVMDAIVWFQFDSALISLDTVGKFSFEKGSILSKSKPTTKLIEGKVFAEYEIRLQFTSNLDFQHFPLDDHRIFVSMVNNSVSPSELMFASDKAGYSFSDAIDTPGWNLVDFGVKTGYSKATLDKYDQRTVVRHPKIVVFLDYRRSGIKQTMLVLLPLFLLFFISLFSFAFDPDKNARAILSLAAGDVSAMIGFRFVMQQISPNVGYFIMSDQVFNLLLIFVFIEFLMAIIYIKKKEMTDTLIIIRGSIFCLFHFGLIFFWIYWLFYW